MNPLLLAVTIILGLTVVLTFVQLSKAKKSHRLLHEQDRTRQLQIEELEAKLETCKSEMMRSEQRSQTSEAALDDLRSKYSRVIDMELELEGLRAALCQQNELNEQERSDKQAELLDLSAQYDQAKAIYDRLQAEVSLLEENLEDLSFGLYRPHYGYATSDEYRTQLELVREKKKRMNRDGMSAVCSVEWAVGGNRKEGDRMTKQQIKVMLRAFNGECDSALAKISWNNIEKMEQRLVKAFESINELGSTNKISITDEYLQASLDELRLAYEYAEKKQEEVVEQRRIREQIREEERAQRDYERAQQEAANEEARYQKALEKARREMLQASGQALADLGEKVTELERKLLDAQAQKQRAISMAQLTRSGHVYIVSNIGSFGEDVFKIGMTRRLEPGERIDELGGASVPFRFDVHAMMFSEDAPALENSFHKKFNDRRLNAVNLRKEFFRVTLDEVEQFARESQGVTVRFTKLAEARHYRETLALRAGPIATRDNDSPVFPDSLATTVDALLSK